MRWSILLFLLLSIPGFSEVGPVDTVLLAQEVADYGLAEKDPEALLLAARMLALYPSQNLAQGGLEEPEEGADAQAPSIESEPLLEPLELLRQARAMNPGPALLKRLDEVQAQVERAYRTPASGILRGARAVRAGHRWMFVTEFVGGEEAVVEIRGDGVSDLDLVIYDEQGNWVDADPGTESLCSVTFLPARDGNFKVIVRNRGDQPSRFRFVLR